ncbi:DHA2 family efflux MFS transporter permease subunit [Rhodobacterales bacterium HKCCE2091]|nr:DHA2 family efflux MFS transporter permease subunit [Rhodobacterales bacterium HKCCE2091]
MQTDALPPDAAALPSIDEAARNRLVIGLLLVSGFTVILNETIMGVALPRLMVAFDVTAGAAQWLTTAFLLTMAVVIPITGFLLQRFHTRTVFLMAMSLFSTGTLVCALAPGLHPLIFGRIVQASGTAMMMPLLMTTVMTLVTPEKRGQVMGNISIVISVAPAIGPTISGVILNLLDWRWMFWLVLPIALTALALGYAFLVNVTTPRKTPLDVISVPLSAVGFGTLVYGLSAIGEHGGDGAGIPPWLPIAVGAVVLAVFVARQLKLGPQGRALLDLRTFRHRIFTVGVVIMGFAMMALFGMIILLPLYLQDVRGLEPVQAGLMLLPGGLIMGLLAPFVGRLFDRHGARKLVIPGTVAISGALWTMATFGLNTPLPVVLGAHVLLSVGFAFLFTPMFTSTLGALPKDLYSYGSAVLGTVQQVAGAAGIALFVSIMSITIGAEMARDTGALAATATGLSRAFLCGAGITMLMIVAGFFVRRPADQMPGAAAH